MTSRRAGESGVRRRPGSAGSKFYIFLKRPIAVPPTDRRHGGVAGRRGSRRIGAVTRFIAAFVVSGVAVVVAQPNVAPTDARAVQALRALDRYLETWNSRDATRWASSLHFPHIRPGPGAFELSATPAEYIKGVDFAATLKTGWHRSEWVSRRVVHVSDGKAHVAGAWQRYTADGRPLVGSVITYVVTEQAGRWGVLSRFAAGPSGLDEAATRANAAAARDAIAAYAKNWNSKDPEALAAAVHYPYVRIDGEGDVEVWRTPADFLSGSEPGRQRTWFDTRLDAVEVLQVSANGVNLSVRSSRRDREGRELSSADAVVLVVRRGESWRVQAVSTMGT
jgi:hypothetical protein